MQSMCNMRRLFYFFTDAPNPNFCFVPAMQKPYFGGMRRCGDIAGQNDEKVSIRWLEMEMGMSNWLNRDDFALVQPCRSGVWRMCWKCRILCPTWQRLHVRQLLSTHSYNFSMALWFSYGAYTLCVCVVSINVSSVAQWRTGSVGIQHISATRRFSNLNINLHHVLTNAYLDPNHESHHVTSLWPQMPSSTE